MTQSSTRPAPSSYFRAAAKALRLSCAINRPAKAATFNDSSSAPGMIPASVSAPCTPTKASFQHCNGRRLSYNQYVPVTHRSQQQHHHHDHHCDHHHHHHQQQYCIPEHFDTPLYTIQRRRRISRNILSVSEPQTFSTTSSADNYSYNCTLKRKPAMIKVADVSAFSSLSSSSLTTSTPTPSRIHRRSEPPNMMSMITVHHPSTCFAEGAIPSLARSNSMPSRRRKRVSHQSTLTLATATTTNHASVSSRPDIQQEQIFQGCCNVGDTVEAKLSETVSCAPNSRAYLNLNSAPLPVSESSSASLAVTGTSTTKVTFAKNHANRPDRYATNQAATSRAFLTASATTLQQSSTRRASGIFMDRCATPTRSLTNASLNSINSGISNNSSVFSTAMPLADSSMSIQSQFSEVSSMLSAAMTASGLPTMMDVNLMRDQVGKSLADEECDAQLVENAHVGVVANVSYVDYQLIAEPCSAAIETWVN